MKTIERKEPICAKPWSIKRTCTGRGNNECGCRYRVEKTKSLGGI